MARANRYLLPGQISHLTHRCLWNCLSYVDLNMVRAGVVADPRQWRWCSYAELLGTGEAKPLVDRDRVAS